MRGVECVEVFSRCSPTRIIKTSSFTFFVFLYFTSGKYHRWGFFDFQDDFHVFPLVTWERENIGDQISTAASQKCTDSNIYLLPL